MRKLKGSVSAGSIFLFLMVAAYATLAMVDPQVVEEVLSVFGGLVIRLAPILLVVFGIMFLSHLLLGQHSLVGLLDRGAGLGGWIFAVAGGILSSGPIYLWYPLLSDLKERGMSDRHIAAFLYNRAVKIPLMPMLIFYFGWSFTLVLSLYMVLLSVLNGLAVERLTKGATR